MTFGMANFKENALTTGCYSADSKCTLTTEIMDLTSLEWSYGPEYPFSTE